jgi:hypothetical protein
MRRLPSPWVTVPVLLGTVAGGVVGYLVTQVSCAPGSCTGAAIAIGFLGAAVAFFGIGTVVVLALRSVAEWRELQDRGGRPQTPVDDDPGPPTC